MTTANNTCPNDVMGIPCSPEDMFGSSPFSALPEAYTSYSHLSPLASIGSLKYTSKLIKHPIYPKNHHYCLFILFLSLICGRTQIDKWPNNHKICVILSKVWAESDKILIKHEGEEREECRIWILVLYVYVHVLYMCLSISVKVTCWSTRITFFVVTSNGKH